jgi:transcriptional regulator with XRE-family HTH domain
MRSVQDVRSPQHTSEPITVALKARMREQHLTFRALAAQTRAHDAEGRGVTYAYLCALTSGREYPSRRSLQLIAAALNLQPRYFAEYRLAELQEQLDGRRVGFEQAWRRYCELVGDRT